MNSDTPTPNLDMEAFMSAFVQKLQASGGLAGKAGGKSFQKDDRRQDFTTVHEQVIPNGATQYTLSLTLRRPIDPETNIPIDKEGSYFVSLEHFLKHSKEGSKVLYKVNVAAKKEVLAAMGFAFTEMAKRLCAPRENHPQFFSRAPSSSSSALGRASSPSPTPR